MLKSDRLYKIFMTSMIVAIAAMLLAMGIISLQKNLKANLTLTINPNYEYRIDYKLDSQEEFLPMFCNTEKDSLGVFVGEGFSLSGAVLSASNLVAENENISFRVYNYTPKPADTTFTHLKMSAGGENMGVAEFSVFANPYEAASPTPNQTTITANASNISIKFKFEWVTMPYTVTTEPSDGNYQFVGVGGASNEFDYTANILPAAGYTLEITITSNSITLTQDTDYTYDSTTGALVINQASITGNIVISCTTALREYTITYELYGGTLAEGVTNPTTYTAATETFTINNPSRTDATFLGWLVNGLTEPVSTVTIPKGSSGDMKIVAQYDVRFIRVSYMAMADIWEEELVPSTEFKVTDRTLESDNSEVLVYGTQNYVATVLTNDYGTGGYKIRSMEVIGVSENGYTATVSDTEGKYQSQLIFSITDWNYVEGDIEVKMELLMYQQCLAPDSLITLSDGTTKQIKDASYDDEYLSWNFYKGCYEYKKPVVIIDHKYAVCEVIELIFDNGATTKAVFSHMFLDADLTDWVIITVDTVANYVGHKFVFVDDVSLNTYQYATLVDYKITYEYTKPCTVLTADNLNCVADNTFNISVPIFEEAVNLLCIFDIKDNMMYDQAEIDADVAQYGVFAYEEWADYLTEWQFYALCVPYMKIPVMKGISSIEIMAWLAKTHVT